MKPFLLCTLSLLVLLAAPAAAVDRDAARAGAAWLGANAAPSADGAGADAVVALRAAGRLSGAQASRRAAALRGGVRSYGTSAGANAKLVLGLQAATGNGRCAGSTDLLRRIAGFGRNGRYGRSAFDQALSMLAFRATGNRPPASTVRFLLRSRGAGGWSFTLSGARRDDVDSTALVILALRATGVSRTDGGLRGALAWLRSQRTRGGGFALVQRTRNEANSTALALMAQRAMGSRDARGVRALRSLQRGNGVFQYTATDAGSRILATSDAVLALSGASLPVRRAGRPIRGC